MSINFNFTLKRGDAVIKHQKSGACYAPLGATKMLVGDTLIIEEERAPLPENMSIEFFVDYVKAVVEGYFDVVKLDVSERADARGPEKYSVYMELLSKKEMGYYTFLNPMTALRTPLEFPTTSYLIVPMFRVLENMEYPLRAINAMILALTLAKHSNYIFPPQGGHVCIPTSYEPVLVHNHEKYVNSAPPRGSMNSLYVTPRSYLLSPKKGGIAEYTSYVSKAIKPLLSLSKSSIDRAIVADVLASGVPMLFDEIGSCDASDVYGGTDFFGRYKIRDCKSNPELVGRIVYYAHGTSCRSAGIPIEFSFDSKSVFPRIKTHGTLLSKDI